MSQAGKFFGMFLFVLLVLWGSCTKDEKIVTYEEDELSRLLSGDSTKTWIRSRVLFNGQPVDLSECDLNLSIRYFIGDSDSLKYEIRFHPVFCDGDTSLVESGVFETVFDERILNNRVIFYHGPDTLEKNISEITSLFLKLNYMEGDILIEEDFEAMVPEN